MQKLGLILGARRVKPLGWLFNQNRSQNEIGRAVRELQAALGEVPTGLIGPGSPGYEKLLRSLDFSARHLPDADNDDHLRQLLKPAKGFDQLWEDWLPLAKQQTPREEKSTTGQIFTWTFDPVTAKRLEAERAKKLALTQAAERGLSDVDGTAPLAGEQIAQSPEEKAEPERARGEEERMRQKEASQHGEGNWSWERGPSYDQPRSDPALDAWNSSDYKNRVEKSTGVALPFEAGDGEAVWRHWNDWSNTLRRAHVGDDTRFAFMNIFAWEGGLKPDVRNGKVIAVAGINVHEMPSYIDAADIPAGTGPEDLTPSQRAAYYKAYFDYNEGGSLARVGGFASLEKIGDKFLTASIADTMFRGGSEMIDNVIQPAINATLAEYPDDTLPEGVKVDGIYGRQVLQALQTIASSPEARDRLLNEIADRRIQYHENNPEGQGEELTTDSWDRKRYNYFRFQ